MFLNRTRNSAATHNTVKAGYYHTPDNTDVTPSTPYVYGQNFGVVGETTSISDVSHKGYKRSLNRGEIVMGDLVLSKWQREQTDCDFTFGPWGAAHPNGWGTRRVVGDVANWIEGRIINRTAYVDQDIVAAKDIVLQKAYAKMYGSPLMLIENAAELGQTLGMLRRPLGGTVKLLKQMHKEAIRNTKKSNNRGAMAAQNAWLELRYGMTPLMKDIEATIDEANVFATHLVQRRLVARASRNFSGKITDLQRLAGGLPSFNAANVTVMSETTGTAAAGIIYDVKNRTTEEQLLAAGGLRLSDLPVSLWNRIPFSFVVDWFAGVSTWLQAISPDPEITILGSWITTVVKREIDLSIEAEATLGPSLPYPETTWRGNGGSSNIKTFDMQREVNPQLTLTPEFERKFLTFKQQADAVALMSQITGLFGRLRH